MASLSDDLAVRLECIHNISPLSLCTAQHYHHHPPVPDIPGSQLHAGIRIPCDGVAEQDFPLSNATGDGDGPSIADAIDGSQHRRLKQCRGREGGRQAPTDRPPSTMSPPANTTRVDVTSRGERPGFVEALSRERGLRSGRWHGRGGNTRLRNDLAAATLRE